SIGGGAPGPKPHTSWLGGSTCLSGAVIGDYSFDRPLSVGDKLVFLDMAHYTMVKNTTFNGVRLPSIATHDPATGKITVSRRFGDRDYRDRPSPYASPIPEPRPPPRDWETPPASGSARPQ